MIAPAGKTGVNMDRAGLLPFTRRGPHPIDLIAALLLRHYPVTFEELIAKVPAYQATEREDAARVRNQLLGIGGHGHLVRLAGVKPK